MARNRLCKNCGHMIRSLNIDDNHTLRKHIGYPFVHSKHNEDGSCNVKGCNCKKAEHIFKPRTQADSVESVS